MDDSAESQYLASKSLTPLESLCSIIATEVSALTFLGIPALAFDTNFSFVQIYIGAIFGRIIIALIFLPKVYDQVSPSMKSWPAALVCRLDNELLL